jgi:hypothetical protein
MRRFVPGDDPEPEPGFPASSMRFSEREPADDAAGGSVTDVGATATVIPLEARSLSDKYRRLCYWQQVINAENN